MKRLILLAASMTVCVSSAHAEHQAEKRVASKNVVGLKSRGRSTPADEIAEVKRLLEEGQLRRGVRMSRKVLRFEPDNPDWNAVYARFRLHSGKADERTINAAKKAIRLKPTDSETITLFAMTKLFQQQFPEARDLAKSLLRANPKDPTAKAIVAVAQSNIEFPPSTNLAGPMLQPDEDDTINGALGDEMTESASSIKSSRQGSNALAPPSKKLPATAPKISKTVSDISSDSDNIIKIIENAGTAHDAYLVAASHFRMHMNKARLLQVLNTWVKNNPKSAYPYYMRGLFEEEFSRLDRASSDFQKALELSPLCVQAMNKYAYVLLRQKKYKESVETYDMVEQLQGMYPASYGRRADALVALNDYQNAAIDYGRAIRVYIGEETPSRQIAAAKVMSKPRQAQVRLLWARKVETLLKAKKYQRAVDEARLLLMFSPGYSRAMDARQRGYQALGQYDLALKDLNGMISLSPRVAPWYKARMEVLTKLGRTQEAAEDKKRLENVLYKGVPQ